MFGGRKSAVYDAFSSTKHKSSARNQHPSYESAISVVDVPNGIGETLRIRPRGIGTRPIATTPAGHLRYGRIEVR